MDEGFVYCWTDHGNAKLYIGVHKGAIDDGYICSSKLMLEQYNERPDQFTRQIIATGTYADMRALETAILTATNAKDDPTYYNYHNNGPEFYNKGHTEATKRKIGDANRGRQTALGRKLSNEAKCKIGDANRGKVHSEETKRKISEAKSGTLPWITGKKHTADTKRKMREAKVGKPSNMTGRKHTEESRQKMSNSLKGRTPWNKGLKKETDERVSKNGCSISNTVKRKIENGTYKSNLPGVKSIGS